MKLMSIGFGLAVLWLVPTAAFAQAEGTEATPAPAKPEEKDYSRVLAKLFSKEALQEFIFKADHLADAIEQSGGGTVMHAETSTGLGMDATIQKTKEATLYYFSVSRGGAELHYSDAVKLVALFTDRCGLPHPCNVASGEHDIYYAQWLFKPSDMKKMKKFMIEDRTRSRAEKDPVRAINLAVQRELGARAASQKSD